MIGSGRPRRFTRVALRAALAAAVGIGVGLVGAAAPAPAAELSYVRLGHFSPDTPNVDVYLTSFSRPSWKMVLPGVGYGALSPYERLVPDLYTVSMRAAGAAPTSAPVISTTVRAASGGAYTVAGTGPYKALGLTVIRDDLQLPPTGDSRVRVIQASVRAGSVTISAMGGPNISGPVTFATTTPYATVPAGQWMLQVASTSQPSLTLRSGVQLSSGSVYTLLVLDAKDGGLQVVTRQDATAMSSVPAGAVETGAGGTAPATTWLPIGLAAGSALLLVAAAVRYRSARTAGPVVPSG